MISIQEFLIRARLEHRSLDAWIAAGWLIPPQTEPELMFSDIDLARAQFIRDLREDFGVNDEGISLVARLGAETRGWRRTMGGLRGELRAGGGQAGGGGGPGGRGPADPPAARGGPPRRPPPRHERIMPNRRTMNVIALAG